MVASNPVLIVGAGVSGLALAQALRKAGLPFKVFESDLSTSFRAQGYRIGIKGDNLQACLPLELWTRFKDGSGKPPQNISRVDAIITECLPSNFGPPSGNGNAPTRRPPISDTFTADRAVLRDLLLDGLEESVAFGHRLRRFDISDEAVVAHFENGSSFEGSLLIAADGNGSAVRHQHLPYHHLLDPGLRCNYGKTIFTEELLQAFPSMAEQCAFLIVDKIDPAGRQLAMFVESMRFQDSEIRADLPDDYGQALPSSPRKSPSTTGMSPYKALLELQDLKRTAALRVPTAVPDIAPWETCSRVTFIGDAIHLMPPTGGIGANTALEDVAALTRILVGNGITESSIKQYEDDMRHRSLDAIEKSFQGAKHMVGLGHWSTFKFDGRRAGFQFDGQRLIK
ncbi:uncharacterized protein A1O9_02548 [Exophiala aquamarina CBS 119918]|uniref:FAD-binding domain-containing protein n=1 Tax=Exophiala aquamarina CBS 119918 TaxID=1182545 RepID=A0A072PLL2_9EURO|nr:uncharacterized protein A1O9_02548 [Exophiala aquamarina CBS 119918]KEF60984.1 hypothetical protein A1O9_02548 [Exophiala aquamarina CBS 119918]